MITVDDIELDDFKTWFTRDFTYATIVGETVAREDCSCEYITDADLTKAFTEAKINFNQGLFGTDDQLKTTFLYLAAHYLVNDLQTATAGVGSAGFFPVTSRSVGSVSESYGLPNWMMNDPVFGAYATTRYGQKYLSLIKPLLVGNVAVYEGATTYK
jgi:hypothetical protein